MGKKVIINSDDLGMSEGFNEGAIKAPVSYTHLTLPTICSV